ncbi:hypothetical protein Pcinc_018610 [Petrolisthes cinctipes]|uniref:Uncharacterized protein n=1 Tax=Petrolisthes cinctipes TaxID=88211 RepID=A0AAE1KMK5_PETCI|nr:hypothetical protein Pcinc_018610 [Petrolisthes cinctipes]
MLGLTQWVREPTYLPSQNILDLVLTTEPDRVLEPVSCPPLPHCSHVIIKFDYVFQVQPPFTNPHAGTRYDWARGDYAGIRNSLRNIDWDFELLSRDLTSLDSFLSSTLHDLISLFVPPMKSKVRTLPWLRRIPKNLTKLRTNIWKEYKELRRQHGHQSHQALQCLFNLNNLNARLKQTTMALQANYEGDLLKDKKTKPINSSTLTFETKSRQDRCWASEDPWHPH